MIYIKRLERYKKSKLLRTFITKDENPSNDESDNLIVNLENYEDRSSIYDIIKEIIFDIVDDEPVTYIITYTINDTYNRLELVNTLQGIYDNEDDFLAELLMFIANDIPVYSNTKELEAVLINYYRKIYNNVITFPEDNNKYSFTDKFLLNDQTSLELEMPNRALSYGETQLLRDLLQDKIKRYDRAYLLLNNLHEAIQKLENILSQGVRNENDIQKCISKFPILFGTEYVEVIPKHKLGGEYETDYVLKRNNGLYDVIELEASTHKLYTKDGNPSSKLTHAEQQIYDWLEWIEHNNSYARETLKEFYTPTGYIVIGRSKDLSEKDKVKLRRRNIILKNSMIILTYDDLLERAKNLYTLLTNNN